MRAHNGELGVTFFYNVLDFCEDIASANHHTRTDAVFAHYVFGNEIESFHIEGIVGLVLGDVHKDDPPVEREGKIYCMQQGTLGFLRIVPRHNDRLFVYNLIHFSSMHNASMHNA